MQRASFQAQTSAVLRGNACLQRRAKLTNACLLLLPLAFCALLFVLQVGIPCSCVPLWICAAGALQALALVPLSHPAGLTLLHRAHTAAWFS